MSRRRSEKPQTPFATRLEGVRESFGQLTGRPDLDKGEFAKMIGIEEETYRRYERGESRPKLETLTQIRRITGVSLNYLVSGDQEGPTKSAPALRVLRRNGLTK